MLVVLLERHLRHQRRIPGSLRKRQTVLDILSLVFAIIGSLGLIILSVCDTFDYPTVSLESTNVQWKARLLTFWSFEIVDSLSFFPPGPLVIHCSLRSLRSSQCLCSNLGNLLPSRISRSLGKDLERSSHRQEYLVGYRCSFRYWIRSRLCYLLWWCLSGWH